MTYINWSRHKGSARGFPSYDEAMQFLNDNRKLLGHACRIEERVRRRLNDPRWFVIHSYGTTASLYFESISDTEQETSE